jgi:GTPase SAR1 family protein
LGIEFIETSAKTGHNVENAFLEVAIKVIQSIKDGKINPNNEVFLYFLFKNLGIKV